MSDTDRRIEDYVGQLSMLPIKDPVQVLIESHKRQRALISDYEDRSTKTAQRLRWFPGFIKNWVMGK